MWVFEMLVQYKFKHFLLKLNDNKQRQIREV